MRFLPLRPAKVWPNHRARLSTWVLCMVTCHRLLGWSEQSAKRLYCRYHIWIVFWYTGIVYYCIIHALWQKRLAILVEMHIAMLVVCFQVLIHLTRLLSTSFWEAHFTLVLACIGLLRRAPASPCSASCCQQLAGARWAVKWCRWKDFRYSQHCLWHDKIHQLIVIDRYSTDHHRSRFKAQSCHGHSWPKSHFDTAEIDSGKTWCDVFVMSSSWHLEIQLGACYTLWAHGPPITLLAYVRGSDFNWFSCPGLKNTTWRTHENKNSWNKQPVLQAAFFFFGCRHCYSISLYLCLKSLPKSACISKLAYEHRITYANKHYTYYIVSCA